MTKEHLEDLRQSLRRPRAVKRDADRQVGLRALTVFARCRGRKKISRSELSSVLAAAVNPARPVWYVGVELLYDLCHRSAECRDAALEAFANADHAARWQLIAGLLKQERLPQRFLADILRSGLADPSARVRSFAVARTSELEVKALLPTLEAMRKSETDRAVRSQLDSSIQMLRDGYGLEPPDGTEPGVGRMTIRHRDPVLGGTAWALCDVDWKCVKRRGAAALARTLRRKLERDEDFESPFKC